MKIMIMDIFKNFSNAVFQSKLIFFFIYFVIRGEYLKKSSELNYLN